ncbi:choline dehydrogenase 7 [Entophlyctis luteolus]|nr:choline dehydrogenase 7 [Entophlyctis luteolus]
MPSGTDDSSSDSDDRDLDMLAGPPAQNPPSNPLDYSSSLSAMSSDSESDVDIGRAVDTLPSSRKQQQQSAAIPASSSPAVAPATKITLKFNKKTPVVYDSDSAQEQSGESEEIDEFAEDANDSDASFTKPAKPRGGGASSAYSAASAASSSSSVKGLKKGMKGGIRKKHKSASGSGVGGRPGKKEKPVPHEIVAIEMGDKSQGVDKLLSWKPASYGPDGNLIQGEQLLVKYKNMSYYHAEWIPRSLFEQDRMGKMRIQKFLAKPLFETQWSEEEPFNPAFKLIDGTKIQEFYDRREVNPTKFRSYQNVGVRPPSSEWTKMDESPVYKNDMQLRAYQLEGLNWLLFCWYHNQNSILADEMGLGKTVQSTVFLDFLFTRCNVKGPFLVIAPLSTIGNWERELNRWSDMNVVVYHGREAARNLIVETEFYYRDSQHQIVSNIFKFDVILTTYEMAISGMTQLRPINWRCVVLDEAHRLKNKTSKISEVLKQYKMEHKVLLTGTPLQNSLDELWALLNFLQPEKFASERDFQREFGNLSSAGDVEKLQALLKPLMLRRLKEDVEKSIPVKEETIIEGYYMLINGAGAEDAINAEYNADTPEKQFQALVQASGKMVLIDKLLKKLKQGGHKVLIFSQMTRRVDSDWNPQNDLQAQSRVHRIGQKKSVLIYRLVTRNTYEREMFDKASMKLGLDRAILQRMDANSAYGVDSNDSESSKVSGMSKAEIEELLKKGAYAAFMDENSGNDFCEEDIDQILTRRTQVIRHDNTQEKSSIFSKATFASSEETVDINDPEFWDKVAKRAELNVVDPADNAPELIVDTVRARKQVQRFGDQFIEDVDVEEDTNFDQICRGRSVNDLKACAQCMIQFSLACNVVEPDVVADVKACLALDGIPDIETADLSVPYNGATKKQIAEYRSAFLDSPKENHDYLSRKAKNLLLRLQMLHNIREKIKPTQETKMPVILGAPVTAWWGENEDRDLLIGTLLHGYGKYAQIASDPSLVFASRLAAMAIDNPMPSLTAPTASEAGSTTADASSDQKLLSVEEFESNGAPPRASTPNLAGEGSRVDVEMGGEDGDVDESNKATATVRLDLLPSASDLGLRIRKIIAAFLRDQATAAREEQKRLLHEERAKARQEKEEERNKLKERELTKRDRLGKFALISIVLLILCDLEFYRTLSSYGVETNKTPTGTRDWTRFKEISQLKKAPEVLEEYFGKLMALCREVVSPTPGKAPLTAAEMDFITVDKAKKLVKRVEWMTKLREDILDSPHLDSSLLALRTIGKAGLPEWWYTEHDKAYLIGIAKWGLNRGDLYVEDDTLPFKAIFEHYLRTTPAVPAAQALNRFWMKEAIAMKRFYALCECVLDPAKKRGSGGSRKAGHSKKQDDSDFDDFDEDNMVIYNPKKTKSRAAAAASVTGIGSSQDFSNTIIQHPPPIAIPPSQPAVAEIDPLEQIRLLQDEISQVVAGVKRKRSKKKGSGTDGEDFSGLDDLDAGDSSKKKKKHKKKHGHELEAEHEALLAGILGEMAAVQEQQHKKKKHKKSAGAHHSNEAEIASLMAGIAELQGEDDGGMSPHKKKSKKHRKHDDGMDARTGNGTGNIAGIETGMTEITAIESTDWEESVPAVEFAEVEASGQDPPMAVGGLGVGIGVVCSVVMEGQRRPLSFGDFSAQLSVALSTMPEGSVITSTPAEKEAPALQFDVAVSCESQAEGTQLVLALSQRNLVAVLLDSTSDFTVIDSAAVFVRLLPATSNSSRQINEVDALSDAVSGKSAVMRALLLEKPAILIVQTGAIPQTWLAIASRAFRLRLLDTTSDAIADAVRSITKDVPTSPATLSQSTFARDPLDIPYSPPSPKVRRRSRLSIVRPKSSLWDIGAAARSGGSASSSPSLTTVFESSNLSPHRNFRQVPKSVLSVLNGPALLEYVLKPSSISAQVQVDLQYARFNPSTRDWLLNDISKWLSETSREDDPVMWIFGGDCTGKTVGCAALIQNLPSFSGKTFLSWVMIHNCFRADAKHVINNLVYRLAESWPEFRSRIISYLESLDKLAIYDMLTATTPQRLHLLLTKPIAEIFAAKSSLPIPTVLFVVDAIDNIKPESSRTEFIQCLKAEMGRLPPFVKFLFTSSFSDALSADLSTLSPTCLDLRNTFQKKDLNKIHRDEVKSLLAGCNNENVDKDDLSDTAMLLTVKSNGSFGFGRFAFDLIQQHMSQFNNLVAITKSVETVPDSMDGIMSELVACLFEDASEEDVTNFRSIMGTLMLLHDKMSIPALSKFLGIPVLKIRLILMRLSCFVDYIGGDCVQITHSCVSEFFFSDACRDDRFRIQRINAESELVFRCLKHLIHGLKANPLILEDPSVWLNDEIPDLPACVNDRIPEHVQYVVKHFANHLEAATVPGGFLAADQEEFVDRKVVMAVQDLVGVFAQEKLLEWMEALSLIKEIDLVGTFALQKLVTYMSNLKPVVTRIEKLVGFIRRSSNVLMGTAAANTVTSEDSKKLTVPSFVESCLPASPATTATTIALLLDASKLLHYFRTPVTRASFHVYTTALPFSPATCQLYTQYNQSAHRAAFSAQGTSRRIPIVIRGLDGGSAGGAEWPSIVHVMRDITVVEGGKPPFRVLAVCESACGRWVVQGGSDGNVRAFDNGSGKIKFCHRTTFILTYQNRKFVSRFRWSYRRCLECLNVVGQLAYCLWVFRQYREDLVQKIPFASVKFNNRLIHDHRLLSTGECLQTINAQSFSKNTLALSHDQHPKIVTMDPTCHTVLVSDSATNSIIWTLKGHQKGIITSICLSTDSSLVASGGEDCTIRLWDMLTGTGVRTFDGHKGAVSAICISSDSRWIVSGSRDMSVRVWNIATGRCWQVCEGHKDVVLCVAISSNGKQIISGSEDGTVRVWEMNTSEVPSTSHLTDDSLGHGSDVPVRALEISKNGLVVASAGIDGLIKIWSTQSGKLLRDVEMISIDGANSFADAVHRVACVDASSEADYEDIHFGGTAKARMNRGNSSADDEDGDLIAVPGAPGLKVSVDRIDIKRREGRDAAVVKIDGKMMMFTREELSLLELTIEDVQIRKASKIQQAMLESKEDSDATAAADAFAATPVDLPNVKEETWSFGEDGWVFSRDARRFWLGEEHRGLIASHQDRIVAVGTVKGQVLIVHV